MPSRRRSRVGAWLSSKGFAAGADKALAAIFSFSGLDLTKDERAFFKDANPFGFILFFDKNGQRNIDNPAQLKKLTNNLKDLLGRDCPILVDQEGGRVQRLKPPLWRQYPPMRQFGETAEHDLEQALEDLRFTILQMAEELRDGGINVNCAPVLDVSFPEMHDVIGDRAFSSDPAIVARLGLSVCRNLLAAGITPVFKHLPGHGRAKADSHKTLPIVEASREEMEQTDFVPFRAVMESEIGGALWGMPTPVKYPALDADHAACASRKIIHGLIRGEMGFDGFLVSDALDMEGFAAYGDQAHRVLAVLKAGCDAALYCAGDLKDMQKIAKTAPKLGEKSLQRLQKAEEFRKLAA